MDKKNKISIITINYNDAVGLEDTIKSVLNQSYSQIEFIVIDGNSNDGSKKIIEKYKNNLYYSVSEEDSGIYNAMNKGIKVATGEYLLFLNSGDVLVDDKNILYNCSQKLTCDIVAFDCFIKKDTKIVGRRTHITQPTLFYVYKNGFKHQSTFVRRSLFNSIGMYNENYKIASDYEFWIRCLLNPHTTSKGYKLPIAIFKLGGISQNSDWASEHQQIENQWLNNVIFPYKKSRFLNIMIKLKKALIGK